MIQDQIAIDNFLEQLRQPRPEAEPKPRATLHLVCYWDPLMHFGTYGVRVHYLAHDRTECISERYPTREDFLLKAAQSGLALLGQEASYDVTVYTSSDWLVTGGQEPSVRTGDPQAWSALDEQAAGHTVEWRWAPTFGPKSAAAQLWTNVQALHQETLLELSSR